MANQGGNPAVTAIRNFIKHNDLMVAASVIGIVLIIVIPIPPGLLDLLLTFSIAFSLVVILTTMFTTEPLQFSVFPSLLLVVTLYRLALNISSTRLILNEAEAGKVIHAFGDFVVGGNYVVGFIVFLIITIIQFVVITNGAGRVSEVAARFTLDAMPGKQMSIDADLSGGLITEKEALEKRERLQKEADFFGAMDGASKFVRGDAIAGIVIILINIAGGLLIGIWQHGMPFTQAAQTYTLLTVGDGLVTQIPALLVSTGTGILVTRAGARHNFGKELSKQVTAFPKVIALISVILFVLGIVPGLPMLPFFIMAGGTGYAAYMLFEEEKKKRERELAKAQKEAQPRQPENVLDLLQVDPLEIEIGYNLIPLTDEKQGGDLLERLVSVRRRCAAELGIFVRPIRIRDNLQLPANTYTFKIRGVETARGEIYPGQLLAMNPSDQEEEIQGRKTREPTFGLPAWWITEQQQEEAELKGFTVVDSTTVLITHLTEFIKQHAHELLGRQEVKEMIEAVKEKNPAVVEELVPDLLTVGEIQKVLQNLLKEKIPVKDLVTILEKLADAARVSKDLDFLTENCRQALYRTISKLYAGEEGRKIKVVTLDPMLEQKIADSLQATQQGNYPVLEPEITQRLLEQLKKETEKLNVRGLAPVVLCSSQVRLPLRRLTERFLPQLVLLSINELDPSLEIESLGTVVLDEN